MKKIGLLLSLIVLSIHGNFKLGLENLSKDLLKKLTYKSTVSVGLITNQTGKDQRGVRNIDFMLQRGIHVKRIFVPEHGFDGTIHAEKDVHDAIDLHTKIPIVSLYRYYPVKKMDKRMLQGIDVLLFDIQDSGVRHFTYISMLLHVMKEAQQHRIPLVVLDRPNILGGIMEGPLVEQKLQSFISIASIPLRYGMTIGELACYFNQYVMAWPAKLHVVKMSNYVRSNKYHKDNLMLSPNVPNIQACYGYSFLGTLGEVRPFDLRVGTNKAFQIIALPQDVQISEKKWAEFRTVLLRQGIESEYRTYVRSKYWSHTKTRKKQQCTGVAFSIKDMNNISTFNTFIEIAEFFKRSGVSLTFSPQFDKAIGTQDVRKFLTGSLSRTQLMQKVNKDLQRFFAKAKSAFLYDPVPKLILMK